MNKINDYIKALSKNDKKTLSQKALKTCEEVGELAKVILPYDSAYGTNHRFIDRDKILEEIVDVYLTNISILHSLEFTDNEFDEMLIKKCAKWQELQSKEDNIKFPIPYEIHITIDVTQTIGYNNSNERDKNNSRSFLRDAVEYHLSKDNKYKIIKDNKEIGFKYNENDFKELRYDWVISLFKKTCVDLGVKPIILDLEIKNDTIKDVMTSSKFIGNNKEALDECNRICEELEKNQFKVVRKKIESFPWHPMAPKSNNDMPKNCYFESHVGVSIFPDDKPRLLEFINSLDLKSGKPKLSQNFFKRSIDGSRFINMVTLRSYELGYDNFKNDVEVLKKSLIDNGFEFEKVEVEFAVYDTNVSHDINWIEEKEEVKYI